MEAEVAELEIGDRLAKLRKARKVSQAQLGRMLGVSQSAIAQLETGSATNYELRTLARYAAALGASVEVKIHHQRRRTQLAKGSPAMTISTTGRRRDCLRTLALMVTVVAHRSVTYVRCEPRQKPVEAILPHCQVEAANGRVGR